MRRIFRQAPSRPLRIDHAAASRADAIAAEWVARLDRTGGGERDHPALLQWLEEDRRHRGAFVRAQAIWHLADEAGEESLRSEEKAPSSLSRRAFGGAVAAAVVAGISGTMLWPQSAAATILRTGFGEIRRFRLPTGGSLVLDGTSEALWLADERLPRLELHAGAAWIDLGTGGGALDLRAGDLRLDAASAALALRRSPVPEVIVERGSVALRGAAHAVTRIGPGSRARRGADAITRIDQMSAEAMDRLLAWRVGDIELDGETVQAAIDRFNAYNHVRLHVTDPRLAAEKVVGRFALHRPEDFAEAVATMFAGQVRREGGTIRIAAAQKKFSKRRRISGRRASS